MSNQQALAQAHPRRPQQQQQQKGAVLPTLKVT